MQGQLCCRSFTDLEKTVGSDGGVVGDRKMGRGKQSISVKIDKIENIAKDIFGLAPIGYVLPILPILPILTAKNSVNLSQM